MQNQPGAEKSDALDDVRGYLSSVRAVCPGQESGEHGEKRRAHADHHVGAQAGGLVAPLALEADDSAHAAGHQQACDRALGDEHLVKRAEVDG